MMTDNRLETHYLEIYQELNKSMIAAKELIKPFLPLEKEIQNLIREIKEARKELDEIFSHPTLYQICSECHKRSPGGCCKLKRNSYLSQKDLIYIVSENAKFELPRPDTKFLASFDEPVCLFLGPKGCLLEENRPIICLNEGYNGSCEDLRFGAQKLIRNGTLSEKQITNLLNKLDRKTNLLLKSLPKFGRDFLFYAPGPTRPLKK